jgi:hypothetical protein
MRVEGWESLLDAHIENAQPFEWGQNDCALWSADWVNLATGVNFASQWRGLYTTEDELAALLAERGFTSHAEIPTASGFPSMHPAFAQRGDIVMNAYGCLGICAGLESYFLMERGVTPYRTKKCTHAWRIA